MLALEVSAKQLLSHGLILVCASTGKGPTAKNGPVGVDGLLGRSLRPEACLEDIWAGGRGPGTTTVLASSPREPNTT